jgi:hypothetical protein
VFVDRSSDAMVHVRLHDRHRQQVDGEITFASVSMIRPLQEGHSVARWTGWVNVGDMAGIVTQR